MKYTDLLHLAIVFASVGLAQAEDHPTTITKPKMSFDDAIKPYVKLAYDYEGYVGPDGNIKGKGLGCSAFTSIVLHRMRDGDNWMKQYDKRVYQWYGDEAAKHFGLLSVGSFPPETLRQEAGIRELLTEKKLTSGTLYFFNARKGKNGHVGFVRFSGDGTSEQWHFSSISNGLYRGEFGEWIGRSMYRTDSTIELYPISELAAEKP